MVQPRNGHPISGNSHVTESAFGVVQLHYTSSKLPWVLQSKPELLKCCVAVPIYIEEQPAVAA